MTGAMAGTAAAFFRSASNKLEVLTLTINNQCNLTCPHCYLQYDGERTRLSESTLRLVLDSPIPHVAIVGKEPLLDRSSTSICERIVISRQRQGQSSSIITNGLGIRHMAEEAIRALAWIDVSLDGGPESYERYRHAKYLTVIRQVQLAMQSGLRAIHAMNTLSSSTLRNVDDMMSILDDAPWTRVFFSPFIPSRNQGRTLVAQVQMRELFQALADCKRFMSAQNATLLMGANAFIDQGYDPQAVIEAVSEYGLENKVIQIQRDPLELGYLRLTYDGFLLTPYQSLHTADYRTSGIPAATYTDLNQAFQALAPVAA